MADQPVTKIYQLQTLGYSDTINQLKNIEAQFYKIKLAKQDLNAELQKKIDAGDTQGIADVTAQIKAQDLAMTKLTSKRSAYTKEAVASSANEKKAVDDVTAAQAKFQKTQSDTAVTVAQYNLQTQLANKANKEIAASTLGLIDDYGLLKKQYNDAAAAAKNLAAISLKTGNADDIDNATAATEKAKALHDSLLQIEQGVGQSQRNVGNYTGALQILEQSLTEAKQKLDAMSQSERDNSEAGQNLQKEIGLLSELAGQQSQGFTSLRREVLNATQALATLEEQGLANTPAFEELQTEVANAKRGLNEFYLQQKLLSSEVPSITALTAAAKGLGAAYAVGYGASQLLGDGSEKTAEKLNKLVAVMTLLQGLTELNAVLQEKSAIATALSGIKEVGLTAIYTIKNFVLTGSIRLITSETASKLANAAATDTLTTANTAASVSAIALRTALIATGIGALLILLTSAALAMSHFAQNAQVAREKVVLLNEVNMKAIDGFVEQKVKVDDLVLSINSNNASLETRKDKLNELIALSPQYLSGLSLENLNTDEGRKILEQYNIALQKKSELEAAQSVQVDAEKDVAKLNVQKQELQNIINAQPNSGINSYLKSALADIQKEIDKAQIQVLASNQIFQSKLNASLSLGDVPKTYEDQVKQIETIRDLALSKENAATAETERLRALSLSEQKTHLLNVEKINVDALNQKIALIQKNKTLNDEQQKDLAGFEEERANIELETSKKIQDLNAKKDPLADEKLKELEAERESAKKIIDNDNATYAARIAALNSFDDISEKIIQYSEDKILNNKKATEKEKNDAIKAAVAERITLAEEESKSLADINKKQYDKEDKDLKAQFEADKSTIALQNEIVQADPNKTFTQKGVSDQQAHQQTKNDTIQFYYDEEALALKYGQDTVEIEANLRKAINETTKAGLKDNLNITKDGLEDIDKATENAVAGIKLKYDTIKSQILSGNKSDTTKNADVTKVDDTQNVEVLSKELDALNNKLFIIGELYQQNKATLVEYEAAYDAVNAKQQQLNDAIQKQREIYTSFKDLLTQKVSDLFGFKAGSDEAKAAGEIITTAFTTAQTAMNAYYTDEEQRIQHSNKINQAKLDLEEQQAEARSQSAAQTASIQRQYAAEKEAADRDAFDKDKKLKLQQAKMAYATTLVNDLASASVFLFPLDLIVFGIEAAAATVTYEIQKSSIESAQYAKGGLIQPAKVGNGKISNRPNIAQRPNGDNIFATIRTGEVILNEEQQIRLGGPSTFHSIGVPGFAAGGYTGLGADLKMGEGLTAPINPGAYLNSGSARTEEYINKIAAMIQDTNDSIAKISKQTNQRIDKLQVYVDPHAVQKANDKNKKASSIGTL